MRVKERRKSEEELCVYMCIIMGVSARAGNRKNVLVRASVPSHYCCNRSVHCTPERERTIKKKLKNENEK